MGVIEHRSEEPRDKRKRKMGGYLAMDMAFSGLPYLFCIDYIHNYSSFEHLGQARFDLESAQTGVGIFSTCGGSGGSDVWSNGGCSRRIAGGTLGSAQRISVRDARGRERGGHERVVLSFFTGSVVGREDDSE